MKRYLLFLCLLLIPLILSGQQQNSYVDLAKGDTITVNITAKDKEQSKTYTTLQAELTRSVDSQVSVNTALADGISTLATTLTEYVGTVNEQTRGDTNNCQWCFVTDAFGFTTERVKHVIRVERWLNFITAFFALVFLIWSFMPADVLSNKFTTQGLMVKLIFALSITTVLSILIWGLLTLILNGDYYVIKELIKLYT